MVWFSNDFLHLGFSHTSKTTKLNKNNNKQWPNKQKNPKPINLELLIVRNTFLCHGLAAVKAQIMGLNRSNSGAVNRKKGRDQRSHFHELLLGDCWAHCSHGEWVWSSGKEQITLDAWPCLLCSQRYRLSSCTFSFVNLMEAEGEAKQTGRQKFAD